MKAETCSWTEDYDGEWRAGCLDNWFAFIAGGPMENNFSYCPYCGERLVARECLTYEPLATAEE